jgi:hypothetical protein
MGAFKRVFNYRKGIFDRIVIRGVRRKPFELAPMSFNKLFNMLALKFNNWEHTAAL